MNQARAKILLQQSRSNIGRLLAEFRTMKPNPDNSTAARLTELSKDLGANQMQQASLLKRFPELRPERVEQMRLNL